MRWCRRLMGPGWVWGWLWVFVGMGWRLGVSGAGLDVGAGVEGALREDQIKATYLFNFTRYVEWPGKAGDAQGPFLVGVIGAPEVEASLREVAEGKAVVGHPVTVRRFGVGDDLRDCRMIYLGFNERVQVERVIQGLGNVPVLVVGEGEVFLDCGGMIGFVKREDRVRIQVGLEAARRAGLQISSRLLSVAESVRGGRVRVGE